MRTNKLKVNVIYPAFMGEVNVHGIGVPCTFVRLAGCNLRCYKETKGILCDTPEALDYCGGKEMTVEEIVLRCNRLNRKVICLTGGEPLLQDVRELLTALSDNGHYIVVETNGTKDISPYRHIRNVSFVVDVKSKSSGESEKMLESNYPLLDKDDFVKFVVDTEDDYEEFFDWVFCHDSYLECKVAVGLFWGSQISYERLFDKLKHDFTIPVYINMQTHKLSCLYDRTKDEEIFSSVFIPKEL